MIKFVQCVRQKPDLSIEEFRAKWAEYRAMVKALADRSSAVKFSTSTTLVVEQNMELMVARGTRTPYDGIVEIYWQRGADMLAYLAKPGTSEQIDAFRAFQESFIDLSQSTFFFTAEDDPSS